MVNEGYADFARRFIPILDEYQKLGVRFALEVHPTEIAFDTYSARKALEAIDYHPAFGFNYDPSHLGYQGVDYVDFISQFPDRIFHVHMKDVYWSDTPKQIGVFGGHSTFGDARRFWNFRSLGRGKINFEEIIRIVNMEHASLALLSNRWISCRRHMPSMPVLKDKRMWARRDKCGKGLSLLFYLVHFIHVRFLAPAFVFFLVHIAEVVGQGKTNSSATTPVLRILPETVSGCNGAESAGVQQVACIDT